MSLLEGDFYLSSGKAACVCSLAQLEFLCREVGGGQQGMGNGHLLLWRRGVGTDEGDETGREIGQRKC